MGADARTDDKVIFRGLCEFLEQRGVLPDSIAELDLNKTQRHIIGGWGSGVIRHNLVDGDGFDATFKAGVLPAREGGLGIDNLVKDLGHAIDGARMAVQNLDTWPTLKKHYALLGNRAAALAGPNVIPREGRDLEEGLGEGATQFVMSRYLWFIHEGVAGDVAEKEVAVRALVRLPYAMAMHHYLGFHSIATASLIPWLNNVRIVKESGRHVAQWPMGGAFPCLKIQWSLILHRPAMPGSL